MLNWWGSPKQERGLKNINDFFTEYFNNLLKQKNTLKLSVLEECNVLDKLRNINIDNILTPNKCLIANYKYEDIIAWLSNNTRSKFNEKLVQPNSELTEFIPIATLNFSNHTFIIKDIQYIANYLRNNKTIEQVYLDNCGINDEQVKILAEVFRLNKTITKLSLVNNKAITNNGIKILLNIKHYSNKLTELKISPNFNNNSEFQLIPEDLDIFNTCSLNKYLEKIQQENKLDVEITNKNLQPFTNFYHLERPMIKDGNELLKLIAESHNEITKTGNIIKKLIVIAGMNGVGTTALSCFLSGKKLEEDEYRFLHAQKPKYNNKIHHEADNKYKLVNNFFISDDEDGVNIIECPGIHNKDIDSIQTILNSYIYWQILELAEKVKFSVVIRDNSVKEVFDATYKQFANIFRDGNGQLVPKIKNELEDTLSHIISVADYKNEEEKNTKIKEEKSKLNKVLKSKNLDEEQKFIITQLEKSINLFKKPSGDTKSFLATLDTKDFFIVISALSLLISTIANSEIQLEREKIFSYIETIVQSKTVEEKNANIALIDEQKRNILEIFFSSKNKESVLPNSVSDANPTITAEEQKNIMIIALKLELQDILSKKNLYDPLIIEHVKKMISLCVRPFSDTLNIKDLSKGKWATIKEIYIKPQKSEEGKIIFPQVLSNLVNENILTVGKIIANFFQVNKHNIISPFISFDKLDLCQSLDPDTFSKNYSLIQPYLPKKILNKSPVQKTEEPFFSALKEIEEVKEAYIKYSNDHLNMVCSFLEIIRKFYKAENIKDKISFQEILGNYVYFLNQLWKALSFCKKLYPQSQDLQPLTEAVEEVKKILIEANLLDQAILDIKLKPYQVTDNVESNKEQKKYYEEALEWLDKLIGPQVEVVVIAINEIKANAHYYLGMIYENSESKLDCFIAIREYINALEIDKNFNFNYGHDNPPHTFSKICKKIGGLFLKLGKLYRSENENMKAIQLIQEAIKYFKVSLSIVPVEKCSSILKKIFNAPNNKKEEKDYLSLEKDLYISLAEFLFKLNLIPQAAFEYHRAASISTLQEEQQLLLKIREVSETKMEENTAFIRSMLEKGRMEDLSMFAKKTDGTRFLSDTHALLNAFVPLPKPQVEQPKNVEPNQSEQLPNDQKEINNQNDTQVQVQEEAPVQPQPTENTSLRTIENIQKPDYWYSEDDIKNILEANIDKNKFSIVTHVDLANPEQVRDALREGIYEDLIEKGKVVLMAINTGHGHWVSMMVSKDNNTNKIIFTYNNPLGTLLDNASDLVTHVTQ